MLTRRSASLAVLIALLLIPFSAMAASTQPSTDSLRCQNLPFVYNTFWTIVNAPSPRTFQVGQNGATCDLGSDLVWSAAYNTGGCPRASGN